MARDRVTHTEFAKYGDVKTWIYQGRKAGRGAASYSYRVLFAIGKAVDLNVSKA